jgi:hypothetical protein
MRPSTTPFTPFVTHVGPRMRPSGISVSAYDKEVGECVWVLGTIKLLSKCRWEPNQQHALMLNVVQREVPQDLCSPNKVTRGWILPWLHHQTTPTALMVRPDGAAQPNQGRPRPPFGHTFKRHLKRQHQVPHCQEPTPHACSNLKLSLQSPGRHDGGYASEPPNCLITQLSRHTGDSVSCSIYLWRSHPPTKDRPTMHLLCVATCTGQGKTELLVLIVSTLFSHSQVKCSLMLP